MSYSRHSVDKENDDSTLIYHHESRLSRNSTGVKEEFIAPRHDEPVPKGSKKDDKMLLIVFCLMVFIGLGNKVFNKLMTLPMHNYPNFLNLLTTLVYIPVCFAYILPMARMGKIPKEQLEMSKKPFAIMGTLDAMAGIMQTFAVTYLDGSLVILLSQAAIPVSMLITKYLLKVKYNGFQYAGALVVAGGIMCVLIPTLAGGSSPLWACIMILSTIPLALSSVYKEIALGETELDPIYLNGWIAVFQLFFSLVLCVPAAYASEPPVSAAGLPANLYAGLKCYFGYNTQSCEADIDDDATCHADKCMPQAPLFVTIYLFFNQLYNLLIILILKYGSANLLFMALTLMVPLGNVAFTLPFVPDHKPLKVTDIIGLIIICSGLGLYRFAYDLYKQYKERREGPVDPDNKYFGIDSKEGLERSRQKLLLNDEDDQTQTI